MWKHGLASGMVSWNSNVPLDDETGYVDETYFDSENGYSSCYVMTDLTKHKDKWMVDSRCTNHLSPYLDDFVSKEDHERNCKTANGKIMSIYGPGTVLLKHNNGEHHKTLVFTGVYYAPHVSHHLLAVTTLTKQGFTCMIGDKTQIWDKTGNLVITTEQLNSSDSLHWFLLSPMQPDSKASSIQRNSNYLLWHGHIGHCSHNAHHHAFNHVSGIPKLDIPPTLRSCCRCSLGKATEQPFPPSITRGTQPLGLVYTDLCEFPVHSRTKHVWIMTFLDDFSGYGSIVCLKRKLDAATAFCNWFVWTKKACGYKLLELCLDHGGEYISSDLWNFLSKNGVEHQMTVPHTPQQNGRAEHFNRTLLEKSEAMQQHACLPPFFWQDAVETSSHIYNRQPIRHHCYGFSPLS